MAAQSSKLALDTAAWASNVASSVFIIFINKILMSKGGYGFQYGARLPRRGLVRHSEGPADAHTAAATTLCALHYLACTLSMTITSRLGKKGDAPAKKVSIPQRGAQSPGYYAAPCSG